MEVTSGHFSEEIDIGSCSLESFCFLVESACSFSLGAKLLEPSSSKHAFRQKKDGWDEYELYAPLRRPAYQEFTARFIPYRLWNNRGEGEMRVWLRLKEN